MREAGNAGQGAAFASQLVELRGPEAKRYVTLVEHTQRVIAAVRACGFGFVASKYRSMRIDQLRRT